MPGSGAAGRRGSGAAATDAGARLVSAARLFIGSAVRLLRQIVGMPDYRAYVEHLRLSHPERAVPSEREFYDEFVRARYGDGPTRCC